LGFWNFYLIYIYFFCGGHALFGAGGRLIFCGDCALFGAGDRLIFGAGGGNAAERQVEVVARKGQLEGLKFICSCRRCLVKKN
jgi:hypothetical protein